MDEEYKQIDIEKENLGDTLNFITDGMTEQCEAVFYEGKAISVELPTTIVRTVAYTENAARGDTSGKVMKAAKLENGHELQVAAFIENGDLIEIDTRTGECKGRAKK
jgi:elongation factor P